MSGPPIQYHGGSWDVPFFIKAIGFILGGAAAYMFVASKPYPYQNNLYFYAWWAIVIFMFGFLIPCIAWSVISWIGKKTAKATKSVILSATPRRSNIKGPTYLIEFRFHGYAKKYARHIVHDVARKFGVKGVTRKRVVPHTTLFGPFKTRNQRSMLEEVKRLGQKYSLIPFTIKGFDYFDNKTNKVVYLNIKPSKTLEDFRWDLSKSLRKITETISVHDDKKKYEFHATIAFKDIDRKFKKIWEYIKTKEEPNIKQHLLRITILKRGKILYEYDFMQKRLLNRQQSLSKQVWKKTINLLNKYRNSGRTRGHNE